LINSKLFWRNFSKPIIGLAPMEGYTDSAFRQICKLINPNIITYTEFTSSDGLVFNAKTVQKKLVFSLSERPILAQIFGKNIPHFIDAAKRCQDMGFTGIDLNMGCPDKKVVRSEHGFALRQKPELACKIIEAVANAVDLPVSVKTRLGFKDAFDLNSFGKSVESAGADMICIHGRTFVEPYNCPANWNPIYELKQVLSIPVLGNGGVTSLSDGLSKLNNLDGFLIGQASFGNPWCFTHNLPEQLSHKLPIILRHAELLVSDKGEERACLEIRKHLVQYVKNIPNARAYRSQLVHVQSLTEIKQVLETLPTL